MRKVPREHVRRRRLRRWRPLQVPWARRPRHSLQAPPEGGSLLAPPRLQVGLVRSEGPSPGSRLGTQDRLRSPPGPRDSTPHGRSGCPWRRLGHLRTGAPKVEMGYLRRISSSRVSATFGSVVGEGIDGVNDHPKPDDVHAPARVLGQQVDTSCQNLPAGRIASIPARTLAVEPSPIGGCHPAKAAVAGVEGTGGVGLPQHSPSPSAHDRSHWRVWRTWLAAESDDSVLGARLEMAW